MTLCLIQTLKMIKLAICINQLRLRTMTLDEKTYKINGCAMKVHNTIGNGFQEKIYQRCLSIELTNAGLQHVRERSQNIFYNGRHVGTRRADFVVEDEVIVEIKALIRLEDAHLASQKLCSSLW